jgi:hypothetical protein
MIADYCDWIFDHITKCAKITANKATPEMNKNQVKQFLDDELSQIKKDQMDVNDL